MAAKNPPNVSRYEFLRQAVALPIVINGVPIQAEVKEFSTGSLGWYLNGRISVKLPSGTVLPVQVGMNLTIVGSQLLAPLTDEDRALLRGDAEEQATAPSKATADASLANA